jgi:hypothetical protein
VHNWKLITSEPQDVWLKGVLAKLYALALYEQS